MKSRLLILSLVILSFIYGCCKDNPTDPVKSPKISLINPDTASKADIISVIGNNFGSIQGTSYVSFNAIKASEYVSWNDTLIRVIVPNGAASGKLYVTVESIKSNEVDFYLNDYEYYVSVTIGTQIWMKRNLEVDHYRNGDPIPQVKDTSEWANLTTGAYCYYYNDKDSGVFYGKLYNWYAVNDPRGLAPAGWHIPSTSEWSELITYLGGEQIAGGKLKASGIGHWQPPNTGATNESGFTALPAGWRSYYGTFGFLGKYAYWWTSSEGDSTFSWSRSLNFNRISVSNDGYSKRVGFSVRCIKDK